MNDLQQILVIIAAIVIVSICFIGRNKNNIFSRPNEDKENNSGNNLDNNINNHLSKIQSKFKENITVENTSLSTHNPVVKTEQKLTKSPPEVEKKVSETQTSFTFDSENDAISIDTNNSNEVQESESDIIFNNEAINDDFQEKNPTPKKENNKSFIVREPEVFVITIMSIGKEFNMLTVEKLLLKLNFIYSENGFFIQLDSLENIIITVANLHDPGHFILDDKENSTCPGVVLILPIPTTIKAYIAMKGFIKMARKISQQLNGRLYNESLKLLKESDLQQMQNSANVYDINSE